MVHVMRSGMRCCHTNCTSASQPQVGVKALAMQVVEEGMGRRGEAMQPLRPVLHRTLADVQERLTFRAQAFIKVSCHGLPRHAVTLSVTK